MGTIEPIRNTWEFTTPQTWEVFSDTDRFNRLAGLGFKFEETIQPDGTVKRTGSASFLGIQMTWDELPFQFVAGEWFRTRREFHRGPAQAFTTTLRIRAREEGGTAIRYTVEVQPRSALARPVLALEMKANTGPRLEKVLKALLLELIGEGAKDPHPPALDSATALRLEEACARVEPRVVGNRLQALVTDEPLFRQVQLSPLALARAWGLEEGAVLQGFPSAVREGVLGFRWDLMCPLCLSPKAQLERLDPDVMRQVHCPSCNIFFDGTFPDSVAVSFRTSRQLRDFEVPIECVGSPQRTPHVLAQEQLGRSDEGSLTIAIWLEEGAYRLRTWPHRTTVNIEARPDAVNAPLPIVVTRGTLEPARARVRPGPVSIQLKNTTDRRIEVMLERRWRNPDVLTAGRLLELPGAASLLPTGALSPDFQVESQRCAVVAAEVDPGRGINVEDLSAQLSAHGPRLTRSGKRSVVATFIDPADAAAAVRDLADSPHISCGLHIGPVLEVNYLGETVPMGRVVDQALAMLVGASPGRPVLPTSVAEDPEVQRSLRQAGCGVLAVNYACTPRTSVHWIEIGRANA